VGAAVAGSTKRGRRWRSSVGATLVPNPPRFAAVGSRAEERAGNDGRLTVSFALGTLPPPLAPPPHLLPHPLFSRLASPPAVGDGRIPLGFS
jgi:hypothetical protein